MFDAGEDLSGKTPDGIFHNDCKILRHGNVRMAIAQGTFNSTTNLEKAEKIISFYITEVPGNEKVDMAFYLATSIGDQSSEVLYAGKNADLLLQEAFGADTADGKAHLDGVVSRKKQFVPGLISALDDSDQF